MKAATTTTTPTPRDMLSACALAVLCLASLSQSAPAPCEQLVQPLSQLDPDHLQGSWALVAGSLDHPASMEALRLRDSITMYFSSSSADSARLSYTQVNRFGDRCQHLPYNISLEENTFTFDVGKRFELTGSFLNTSCPDCLVMRWLVKSQRRVSSDLYLLSRRRQLQQREMEEFRAQLRCYHLPSPVVMDPTKELCPEGVQSLPTAAAEPEETARGQEA